MTDPPKRSSLAELAYRQYRLRIYRFFMRRTGSPADAEDLTQRVFTDAVEAFAGDATPPDSMLAWLYTVAHRRMTDEIRQRSRQPQTAAAQSIDTLPLTDEYGPNVRAALETAIAQLSEEQRTVVVLRLLRGLPFAEIAELVGQSEAACKMRFARGITRIRKELEDNNLRP
jgi:RNA polymerase sigma-70 factor (ECF subfamily)